MPGFYEVKNEEIRAVEILRVRRGRGYMKCRYPDNGEKFYQAILRIRDKEGVVLERASRKHFETAGSASEWSRRHKERYQRIREAEND